MDRLREALEEVAEIVKTAVSGEPRTRVEEILDEHLPAEEPLFSFSPRRALPSAIPTNVMNDLASRTNNIVDYPFIMSRIWEVLIDFQHEPPLMKKALILLQFVLINGSIQVLKDCQDPPRSSFMRELASDYNRYEFEQYRFSTNLDVGAGVRKLAADINNYLTDERELFKARRQAEKLHQSLSDRGLRVASVGPEEKRTQSFQSGISYRDESRPLAYLDKSSYSNSRFEIADFASRLVTHASFPLAATPIELQREYRETDSDDSDDKPRKTKNANKGARTKRKSKKDAQKQSEPLVDLINFDTVELHDQTAQRRASTSSMQKMVATI